ncbi:MAG: MauE/DoxX family redox-associated membrane protein [Microbacterium sp.]
MWAALAVALPLVLAGVLIASGVAKLRHPDDLAGWAALGIPAGLRRRWLLRAHPWGELVLGAALALLGGVLGLLAALVSLALMAVYLVMIVRVARRHDDTSCACFGAPTRVTRVTVWRNAWLTALAAGAAGVIWALPPRGGAVAAGSWGLMLGLVAAAVTVAVVMWRSPDADAPASTGADLVVPTPAEQEADYLRTRTPAIPLLRGDGEPVNLRTLTMTRPLLLLAVSETCGACRTVIAQIGQWRARLPEVDVRFLLRTPPGVGLTASAEEPQSLHDVEGNVRKSIQEWSTPTAVLFGADGMLAGGPVSGGPDIAAFIDEVDAALHDPEP